MPHDLSDGRIPDSMLHAYLESDEYNMPDDEEDEDIEGMLEDQREDEAEDRRLFG